MKDCTVSGKSHGFTMWVQPIATLLSILKWVWFKNSHLPLPEFLNFYFPDNKKHEKYICNDRYDW